MHGVQQPIPSMYPDEITLIEEYRWTYADIRNTPRGLIEELLIRIYAKRKWTAEKQRIEEAARQAKEQASKRGNR